MNCKYCNSKIDNGYKYCPNCGKSIEDKVIAWIVIVTLCTFFLCPFFGLIVYFTIKRVSIKTARICFIISLFQFIFYALIIFFSFFGSYDNFNDYDVSFFNKTFSNDDFDIELNDDFTEIINTKYIGSYLSNYMQINVSKEVSEYSMDEYMENLVSFYEINSDINTYNNFKYLIYERNSAYNYIFVYSSNGIYYVSEFTINVDDVFEYNSIIFEIVDSMAFNN